MIYNVGSGSSAINMIIRVTVPDDKVGKTITCTLDSTVLTDTVPASKVVEFKVKDFGDWVIECDGLSKTVNTYYYGLYLVNIERELIALVPIMTGDTTPYGEVLGTEVPPYYKWKVFNGQTGTDDIWYYQGFNAPPADIGYKFVNPVCVKRFSVVNRNNSDQSVVHSFRTAILQASNDGITWDNIGTYSNTHNESLYENVYDVDNDNYYLYHRLHITEFMESNSISLTSLQFYGYED